MIMHKITLDGYAAQCAEQPIRLGTAGSYGVETLSVMRKGEWVDYDIIVAFHPPKGESVQIRLESDNAVSVPARNRVWRRSGCSDRRWKTDVENYRQLRWRDNSERVD